MTKRSSSRKNFLQFHLIGANFTGIVPEKWNYPDLHAHFWRLYNPDRPGSAVTIKGHTIPMTPDHIYLIPPKVHFQAKTIVAMTQFNIHFQIPPFIMAEGHELLQLEITPVIGQMIEICRKYYEDNNTERMRLAAIALTTYCLMQLPEDSMRRIESRNFRIARVCSSLENLYHEKTSIRRIVQFSGLGSKSTLMRSFKKETGTTPYQFQLKKKYAYAAELLKTTDHTVGEICEIIGIGNQFQFSRYFKKLYGLPPMHYRMDAKKTACRGNDAEPSGKNSLR